MRYDYNMFSPVPEVFQGKTQHYVNDHGFVQVTSQQTALWRDPEVALALRGADEVVKTLFRQAGFGLRFYDSGAPKGQYFADEGAARQAVEARLLELLTAGFEDGSLTGANWNGFSLERFLESLELAKPIEKTALSELCESRATAPKANFPRAHVALAFLS